MGEHEVGERPRVRITVEGANDSVLHDEVSVGVLNGEELLQPRGEDSERVRGSR